MRLLAFEVLRDVAQTDAYANLLLPHRIEGLKKRDAGFVTELVYGTLRLQGRYDAMIDATAARPDRLQPALRIALRMGAHQLTQMRQPARAAVNETVNVVSQVLGPAPVGLANAVLRRIAEEPDWQGRIMAMPGGFAKWYSHPEWIISAFRQSLALEGRARELEALLDADNTPAPLTLVARPGLAERPADHEPTRLSPYGYYTSGQPGRLPDVRAGRVGVQDEGSQLIAQLAAQAPLAGRDENWLDMCAGPGGKTALLGALARQRGAFVTANEIQPHRAALVERSVKAVADAVEVVVDDGRRIGALAPGEFDRILLDAPCTGLGSLRRRPEARWRRSVQDLADLTELQRELIDSAVAALRPGGVLVYATCSPHPAETVTQVREAMRRHHLELVPAPEELPQVGEALPGAVQLWPHSDRTDAMFGAVLRRAE